MRKLFTSTKEADTSSCAKFLRYSVCSVLGCLIFQMELPFRKCTWAELVQIQARSVMSQQGRFRLLQDYIMMQKPSGKRSKMWIASLGFRNCLTVAHQFGNNYLTAETIQSNKAYLLFKSVLTDQFPKCVRRYCVFCLYLKCLVTLGKKHTILSKNNFAAPFI